MFATNFTEIAPSSPAILVEFDSSTGRYRITREGKGDYLEFSRSHLVRYGQAPVTGSSVPGPVVLHWSGWTEDMAAFTDRRGRQSEVAGLSATVEEMAFLYLS